MKMTLKKIFLTLLIYSATSPAQSAEIDFFGTLSQGYIKTNSNNYFGDSTKGSFDFREIGVGSAVRFSDDLRASGLLLSRKAGTTADGKVEVDHLFVEYAPIKTQNETYGIRVGRQKIPFGFYNESRDIAESRPSILLPQSIYFDNARSFLTNADGMQLYNEHWSDGAYIKTMISVMTPNGANNPQTEAYYFSSPQKGKLNARVATGLRVEYITSKSDYAVYIANSDLRYAAGSNDYLNNGRINTDIVMWLSAKHTLQNVILTSELFTVRSKLTGFGTYLPDFTVYPFGMYAQAEWLASEKWQFFTRYDFSASDSHDLKGNEWSAKTGKPATSFFSKDFTVGGRYHFTPNTSLRAEMHFVKGTNWLPATDNSVSSAISPSYNIFALQLSHSF
jgi:hypothetical protein